MERGVIRWFSDSRGYGFIEPSPPADTPVYVHHTDILGRGYRSLAPGQVVHYQLEHDGGQARAREVEAV